MNTGGTDLEGSCAWKFQRDKDSCYNTTGPSVLPQPPKIITYACQVWMHSGVIKHLPLPGGSGPHSHWWSDMKRSAWGFQKAVWMAATASSKKNKTKKRQNRFTSSGFWSVHKLLRVMPSLHVYKCWNCSCFKVHNALLFSFKCSIALEETRVKKSETYCF